MESPQIQKQIDKTKIELMNTTDLIPYENNTRTHEDWQVDKIAASIEEFGFTNPILCLDDGTIVATWYGIGRRERRPASSVFDSPLTNLKPRHDAMFTETTFPFLSGSISRRENSVTKQAKAGKQPEKQRKEGGTTLSNKWMDYIILLYFDHIVLN